MSRGSSGGSPRTNRTQAFTVVDLFAGVGGLSYGFEHSNAFRVVAANEILAPMAEAYRLNHPQVQMFEGDVKEFGLASIRPELGKRRSVDVVVGGPPCQAYSTVGKRLLDDPRGSLFKEYFRILQELRPTLFIFENVKGLLSMANGELLITIIELFASLGYSVQFKLLNSADFGVPQTRERVILVGTRGRAKFEFPWPTHRNPEEPTTRSNSKLPPWLTLGEAISDLPMICAGERSDKYQSPPQNDYQQRMRRFAPSLLMDHNAPNHNPALIELMEHLPEGGSPLDIPEHLRPRSGFPNTYCRLWWERPCTTVTRNLGTPSSSRCIHPFVARGLTTRKGARIQSFPDSYRFVGSRSDRNLQIGNAVPPILSTELSNKVLEALTI